MMCRRKDTIPQYSKTSNKRSCKRNHWCFNSITSIHKEQESYARVSTHWASEIIIIIIIIILSIDAII